MPSTKFRISKGFSLIEILIVITIIAILIGAATASYTQAQKNGRDAKRKSDLAAIQQALELYYQNNGKYPTTTGTGGAGWVNSKDGGTWIPLLGPQYISALPVDPVNSGCGTQFQDPPGGGPNCFTYAYYSHFGFCSINDRDYILTTKLEGYGGTSYSQQPYLNDAGNFCNNWKENPTNGLYVVKGP